MKTQQEIEQLAKEEYKDNLHNLFFTAAPMGYIKGYTQCQEDFKPLIHDLWQLWLDLAEAGDLQIGMHFNRRFDELENKINKQY